MIRLKRTKGTVVPIVKNVIMFFGRKQFFFTRRMWMLRISLHCDAVMGRRDKGKWANEAQLHMTGRIHLSCSLAVLYSSLLFMVSCVNATIWLILNHVSICTCNYLTTEVNVISFWGLVDLTILLLCSASAGISTVCLYDFLLWFKKQCFQKKHIYQRVWNGEDPCNLFSYKIRKICMHIPI